MNEQAKDTVLTPAATFFYNYAGYSYGPNETPEQGRIRGAERLVLAEHNARLLGWRTEWELETERAIDVFGPPDDKTFYDPNAEFYACILRAENGEILGSLSMIETPTCEYRRVVEAELALEAGADNRSIAVLDSEIRQAIAKVKGHQANIRASQKLIARLRVERRALETARAGKGKCQFCGDTGTRGTVCKHCTPEDVTEHGPMYYT